MNSNPTTSEAAINTNCFADHLSPQVDGSASRTGQNQVRCAVVTHHEVLKSGSSPSHYSSQAAELVALAEACKLAQGKTFTIYTDSRYAFGVVHDFGALEKKKISQI